MNVQGMKRNDYMYDTFIGLVIYLKHIDNKGKFVFLMPNMDYRVHVLNWLGKSVHHSFQNKHGFS